MSKVTSIGQTFKMTKCLQIRKGKPNSGKQNVKLRTRGEPSRILQMPETPKPKGKLLSGQFLSAGRSKRKSPDTTPEIKKSILVFSPKLNQSPRNDITWKVSSPISVQLMTQSTEPDKYVPDRVVKTPTERKSKSLINVWKTKKQIENQNGADDTNNANSFKRPRLENDERCSKMALSQIIKKPVSGFNSRRKPDFTIFDDNEWPDEDEFQNPDFLQATQEMEDISLAAKKHTVLDAPQPTPPLGNLLTAAVVKCPSVKRNQTVQRQCSSYIAPKSAQGAVPSKSLSERTVIAPNAVCEIMKPSQLVKKSTLNGTTNFTEIRRKSQHCTQPVKCAPLPNPSNSVSDGKNLVAQHQPKPKDNFLFEDLNVFDESFDKLVMENLDSLGGNGSEDCNTVPDQLGHTSAVSGKPATAKCNKVQFVNVGEKGEQKERVGKTQPTKSSATTRNKVEGNFDSKQKVSLSNKPTAAAAKGKAKLAETKFTNIRPKENALIPKIKTSNKDVPSRNITKCTSDKRLNTNCSLDANRINCSAAGSLWPDDDDDDLFFNSPQVLAEFQKFDAVAISKDEEIRRKHEAAELRRQKKIASRLMIPR